MTDWLKDVPVYVSLDQISNEMNKAAKADKDEFERCNSDMVLAGLVCYLAKHHAPDWYEYVLQIIDVYCGKPVE